MDAVKLVNYANKGKAAEETIELSNYYYQKNGIAVVHKVPISWVPRWIDGHVVAAHVEKKGIVDFLGVWKGRAVAFDVKQNSQPRWSLKELKPHQYKFLTEWEASGGIAFILLYNVPSDSWHVMMRLWYEAMSETDVKSIKAAEVAMYTRCEQIPGCPADYIGALEGVLRGG